MSFKRVADDFDDFNIQRKRRVNDLLLNNIPSDEITLMSNGKLACLVCHHRPVFDTTAMITLHRNSKKHLANVLIKLERAKEDAEIIQRREHEQYLKNSSNESPLIGKTRKNKELALNSSSQGTNVAERNSGDQKTHKSHTRKGKAIDGRSSKQHSFPETFSATCDSASGRIHSESTAQTGFFRAKTNFNSQATNSIRDYKSATSSTQSISKQSQDIHGNCTSFLRPNTSLSSVVHMKQNNVSKRSPIGYNHLGNRKDLAKRRFLAVNPLTQKKVQPEEELCDVSENEQNSVSSTQNSTAQQELSEYDKLDQTSKALYVSKLRQLGWILGLDGKWQKDENVEFDSDEDEPPSPKSVL